MLDDHLEERLGKKQFSAKTILIVEDDADIGFYLVEAIKQETPYHTFLVTDSLRALEAAKQIKLQLFILDYHLPYMNGIKLYDQLHAIEGLEAIPAILMSVTLPQEVSDNESKQRNLTILRSPHDLADLIHTIESLML